MLALGIGIQLGGKGGNTNEFNSLVLTWLNQTSAFDFNTNYREFGANNSQANNNWNVRNIWTQNVVSGSNWDCEFEILNPINQTVLGITDEANSLTVNGFTDINFAVVLQAGSVVLSYENGVFTGPNTPYVIGDKFQIKRVGSVVKFYKNNVFQWDYIGVPINVNYKIKLDQWDVDGYNHILRINNFQ